MAIGQFREQRKEMQLAKSLPEQNTGRNRLQLWRCSLTVITDDIKEARIGYGGK